MVDAITFVGIYEGNRMENQEPVIKKTPGDPRAVLLALLEETSRDKFSLNSGTSNISVGAGLKQLPC